MKQNNNMKVIGITGGVGSGKTEVLSFIENMVDCIVIRADELAKSLEKSDEVCYQPLVDLLGVAILGSDNEIDYKKMATAIFSSDTEDILSKVNNIIHPEVKKRILSMIDIEKNKGQIEYFFIEAALLIEDNYDTICDEMWYIYTDVSIRRQRLKESRGYSDSKIDSIIKSQLDDAVFRRYCKYTIDNSGRIEETKRQLETLLNGAASFRRV